MSDLMTCPNTQELAASMCVSSLLFAVYSEYKTGNVWIRTDDKGDRKPSLGRLGRFMASPLWKKDLWNMELLHQNYIAFSLASVPLITTLYRGVGTVLGK